jgi:hypothetical protein
MLLLQFDPLTTEIAFREQPLPPVTANFSEFTLTTDLNLTVGTVTVTGSIDFTEDGKLDIGVNGIIEVL